MELEIKKSIIDSIKTKEAVLADATLLGLISKTSQAIIDLYKRDGCVFAAGNGGSASDAQHVVGEFVGRFNYDRAPLRAYALSANMANITCIGNDYGYDEIFARQIQGCARKGDLFIAISTSGNSKNIIKAVEAAKKCGVTTVGMTGAAGGKLSEIADWTLKVPSKETPRIQESHILFLHVISEMVELGLFPKK